MSNPYAPPDPNRPKTPPRQVPPREQRESEAQRRGTPAEPPSPEQLRGLTRQMLLFGALMLCTLLTSQAAFRFPNPWVAVAIAVGVGTMAAGVRVLRRVLRLRWRGLLPVMLVAGIVISGVSTVANGAVLVLWDEYTQAQECRDRAVTISALQQCETQLESALAERTGRSQP